MDRALPDYQRAFEQSDFRGYFTWTPEFTSKLSTNKLYHACHEEELISFLKHNILKLRSKWSLILPEHGECDVPGVWTSLNYFNKGNNYGPLLIAFPLEVLNGKNFMAFRREETRKRYFFIQYEAKIPIYSFDNKIWRKIKPETYFDVNNDALQNKIGAIYDIVLTEPISLVNTEIRAITHPRCISGKCNGVEEAISKIKLRNIAKTEFRNWLINNMEYDKIVKRFSVLDGVQFELFDPDFEKMYDTGK